MNFETQEKLDWIFANCAVSFKKTPICSEDELTEEMERMERKEIEHLNRVADQYYHG
jgi:hypothetical protein